MIDQHSRPKTPEKIPLQVTGEWDSNIFAILGKTNRALKKIGRRDLVKSVTDKVTSSKNYSEALNHCMEVLSEAGYEVC